MRESDAVLAVRKSIVIRAPAAKVWGAMADVGSWSRWNPAIASSRFAGEPAEGAAFRWRSGGVAIASRFEAVLPPRRLVWSGEAFGMRVRHAWEFREDGGATVVTTEELAAGWLTRLLKPWMRGLLERSLEAWLAALKRRCEAEA